MSKPNPESLTDQIRRALEIWILSHESESLYRVAKTTGIDLSTLSKFRRGLSELSAANLDKLAGHMGLEVR